MSALRIRLTPKLPPHGAQVSEGACRDIPDKNRPLPRPRFGSSPTYSAVHPGEPDKGPQPQGRAQVITHVGAVRMTHLDRNTRAKPVTPVTIRQLLRVPLSIKLAGANLAIV